MKIFNRPFNFFVSFSGIVLGVFIAAAIGVVYAHISGEPHFDSDLVAGNTVISGALSVGGVPYCPARFVSCKGSSDRMNWINNGDECYNAGYVVEDQATLILAQGTCLAPPAPAGDPCAGVTTCGVCGNPNCFVPNTSSDGECLLYNTLVLMSDGLYKVIQNVEIGDMVQGIDGDMGKIVDTRVMDTLKNHLREAYYVINGELKITNDHPVAAMKGGTIIWVRVKDLKVGDAIQSLSGAVTVKSIEFVSTPAITAQLETEIGNFLVKGDHGGIYLVKGWKTY